MVTIAVKVSTEGVGFLTQVYEYATIPTSPSTGGDFGYAYAYGGAPVQLALDDGDHVGYNAPTIGFPKNVAVAFKNINWVQFAGITIPQGATINSAVLTLAYRNYNPTTLPFKANIRAVAGIEPGHPYGSGSITSTGSLSVNREYNLAKGFPQFIGSAVQPFAQYASKPFMGGVTTNGAQTRNSMFAPNGGTMVKTITIPQAVTGGPSSDYQFARQNIDVKDLVQRLVQMFSYNNDIIGFDVRADPRMHATHGTQVSVDVSGYAYENWSQSAYPSQTGYTQPTTLGSGLNVPKLVIDFTADPIRKSANIGPVSNIEPAEVTRNIVSLPNGDIYTVGKLGTGVRMFRATDEVTWLEQDSINRPNVGADDRFGMAVDSTGIIHVVYTNGTTNSVRYATFNSNTNLWVSDVAISLTVVWNTGKAQNVSVSIDSNDKVHISAGMYYTNNIGGSFKTEVRVTSVDDTQIWTVYEMQIGLNDIPYFAGVGTSGGYAWQGNANDATTFAEQLIFGGIDNNASIAIAPNGDIMIVAQENNRGFDNQKHLIADPWGTWQGVEGVFDPLPNYGGAGHPTISYQNGEWRVVQNIESVRNAQSGILEAMYWHGDRGAWSQGEIIEAWKSDENQSEEEAQVASLKYQFNHIPDQDTKLMYTGDNRNEFATGVIGVQSASTDFNFSLDADLRYAPYLRSCGKVDAIVGSGIVPPTGNNEVQTAIITELLLNGPTTGFGLLENVINTQTGQPYKNGEIKNNIGAMHQLGFITGAPYVPPSPEPGGAYNFKKTTWTIV